MTLEQYIRSELARGVVDFSLRAETLMDGRVAFYIHPEGRDGLTRDFLVVGNSAIARFQEEDDEAVQG